MSPDILFQLSGRQPCPPARGPQHRKQSGQTDVLLDNKPSSSGAAQHKTHASVWITVCRINLWKPDAAWTLCGEWRAPRSFTPNTRMQHCVILNGAFFLHLWIPGVMYSDDRSEKYYWDFLYSSSAPVSDKLLYASLVCTHCQPVSVWHPLVWIVWVGWPFFFKRMLFTGVQLTLWTPKPPAGLKHQSLFSLNKH